MFIYSWIFSCSFIYDMMFKVKFCFLRYVLHILYSIFIIYLMYLLYIWCIYYIFDVFIICLIYLFYTYIYIIYICYRVWMIGHQILTLVNKGSPDVTQNLFNFVQSSLKSKQFPQLNIMFLFNNSYFVHQLHHHFIFISLWLFCWLKFDCSIIIILLGIWPNPTLLSFADCSGCSNPFKFCEMDFKLVHFFKLFFYLGN